MPTLGNLERLPTRAGPETDEHLFRRYVAGHTAPRLADLTFHRAFISLADNRQACASWSSKNNTNSRGLRNYSYELDVAPEAIRYDANVLGVILPELGGWSPCRERRAQAPRAPVLMLTTRDAVDDPGADLATVVDDDLVKPFAFREPLACVRAALPRTLRKGGASTSVRPRAQPSRPRSVVRGSGYQLRNR